MADELSEVLHDMELRVPPFVLTMHSRTMSCLTYQEIAALRSAGLITIGIGPERPVYMFQRENFKDILKQRDLIMNMSKDHCELVFQKERLFATNLSIASTTQMNRRYMDVSVAYELHDGSELCMFGWLQYTVKAMRYTTDKVTCRGELEPTMIVSHLIHVMFANPLITKTEKALLVGERLSFKNEYHSIISGLSASLNPLVSVKLSFATYFSLHRALLDGCRVLHFGGHGRPGEMFFEGNASEPLIGTLVDCDTFTKCLNIATAQDISGVALVVLLVCHSETMVEPLLNYGTRHVIAIEKNSKLRDWVAPVFSQRFYWELASGATIQNAYNAAVQTVGTYDLANAQIEAAKILLLPDNADHHETILPITQPQSLVPRHFSNPFERCLASETFEYRHKEECVISTYLARPPHHPFYTRLMVLTGVKGVGKSHLARAVGDDLEIRGFFDGGVHVVDVQGYVNSINHTSGANIYADVQAEVSASLKAFGGAWSSFDTTPQCLIILDGCDILVEHIAAFAAFVDGFLSSQPSWKVLVTCATVDDRLQSLLGFSIMCYNVQPLGYEECCQLFCHLMAKAKYPMTIYHLQNRLQALDPTTPKNKLWKLLVGHPITRMVLRGIPGTITQVVNEIVARKTTVDAWYDTYTGP